MESTVPKATAARSIKNIKARANKRQLTYRNPRLTISKSLPVFLFVGILFTSVGSVILYIFRNAEEVVIDYTHCTSVSNSSQSCAEVVSQLNTHQKCWCEVPFRIENEMKEPVFLFYGLITFFQIPARQPADDVSPEKEDIQLNASNSIDYQVAPSDHKVEDTSDHVKTSQNVIPATPEALVTLEDESDSYFMFADTLTVFSISNCMYVPLIRTGVAWPDMRCGKCSRHSPVNLKRARANFSRSRLRKKNVDDMDPDRFENDDFMVWMQPVTLSTFRKLYRRVNYGTFFNGSLPKGDYQLLVTYTYPVATYGGSKSLIVANSTVLGAKNVFLGIAYVVTGCICLIISFIFCGIRLRNKMIRKKKV